MTNYYVYYRVDDARLGRLRNEIAGLLAAIERETGVRGRWMRRSDDLSTYMEVYEDVSDEAGFEAVLARESAKLGPGRTTERFVCA